MRPLFDGEVSAFIHADTAAQIRAALAFTKKQKITKVVIVGAQDAWRVADQMRAQGAAAILSPINELPLRRWERVETPQLNPQRLSAADVKFCIANDGNSFAAGHERNLPYQAARAALSPEEANAALFPWRVWRSAPSLPAVPRQPGRIVRPTDPPRWRPR